VRRCMNERSGRKYKERHVGAGGGVWGGGGGGEGTWDGEVVLVDAGG